MTRLLFIMIVVCFSFSCSNMETELSRFERLIEPESNLDTLAVDVTIDSEEFSKILADSLSVNFCDTTLSFFGLVPLTDEKVRSVQLTVYEMCYPDFPALEKLEILVKSEYEARVDLTYVPLDSVGNYVLHELESRIWRDKNIKFRFACEWQNVSEETVRRMFEESLRGLNLYAEQKSRQWFSEDLESLSEEQFREFKDNFTFTLDIASVRPDPPPRDSLLQVDESF